MFGYLMIPCVGFIPDDFTPRPNPGEVDKIFSLPLRRFLKKEGHTVSSKYLCNYFLIEFGKASFHLLTIRKGVFSLSDRKILFQQHPIQSGVYCRLGGVNNKYLYSARFLKAL